VVRAVCGRYVARTTPPLLLSQDGDGYLGKQECEATLPKITASAGAGSMPGVSPEEFFDLMDEDKDGRVTRTEAKGEFDKMAAKGAARHKSGSDMEERRKKRRERKLKK
jgi:hypothetical protein